MMNANRWIQIVCVLITALSVLGASLLVPTIQQERQDLQLSFNYERGEDMPWEIALATTTLASFRGLILDVLWYRTEALKNRGDYQEADTLARWITKLQPRFGQVWVFQAWNMAYNISVGTYTPEERWEWVQKGINLLRSEGIPANEGNVALYQQLSWIFMHKIGMYTDDMHWYYKSQLAREWAVILGPQAEGGTAKEVLAEFRKIVDAPELVSELRRQNPDVEELIEHLQSLGIHQVDEQLAKKIGIIQMYNRYGELSFFTQERVNELLTKEGSDPRLLPVVLDEERRPALDKLLATLRKRILMYEMHMDPAFMYKCMTGEVWYEESTVLLPIDWRHPSAHGLYWSILGTEKAIYKFEKKNLDQLNTYRHNIHSLQSLMYSGRIVLDPYRPPQADIQMLVDPRFIPAYDLSVERGKEYLRSQEFYNAQTEDSFDTGHMNFLEKAVIFSYFYGDMEQAQFYMDKVRRLYGDKYENSGGRYNVSVQQFVDTEYEQILKDGGEYVNRVNLIDGMVVRSIELGLMLGDMMTFERYRRFAMRFFSKDILERERGVGALQRDRYSSRVQGMTEAEAFREFEATIFITWMRRSNTPIVHRSRVWHNAPSDLKLRTYDRLIQLLTEQAREQQMDVQKAFPAPEGLEEWRKENPPMPEEEQHTPTPQFERK